MKPYQPWYIRCRAPSEGRVVVGNHGLKWDGRFGPNSHTRTHAHTHTHTHTYTHDHTYTYARTPRDHNHTCSHCMHNMSGCWTGMAAPAGVVVERVRTTAWAAPPVTEATVAVDRTAEEVARTPVTRENIPDWRLLSSLAWRLWGVEEVEWWVEWSGKISG